MLKRFFSIILSIMITPGYAWNALGHEVIATIAYENLKPDIQKSVDVMAATFSKEYPNVNSFVQMASWPDSLHSQKIEIYSHWHYIDQYISADGTPITTSPDTDNVIFALNQMKPILHNKNANAYEKAQFLAFFVHCVGDLHQPLHAAARVSAQYPKGDLGGNLYYVYYPDQNKKITLHMLWDKGLNLLDLPASDINAHNVAQTLIKQYPESYFDNKVNDLIPEHWAVDSLDLAMQITYQTPEYQIPSDEYIELGTKTAEEQLALAGYRLAHLLNTLL